MIGEQVRITWEHWLPHVKTMKRSAKMGMGCGRRKGYQGPGDRIYFTNVVRSALQVDIYLHCWLAGMTVNLETGLRRRARPHRPSQGSPWLGVQLGRQGIGVQLNSSTTGSPAREWEQVKLADQVAGNPTWRDKVQLLNGWRPMMSIRHHWG